MPAVGKILVNTWPLLNTPESHKPSSLVVLWKSDTQVQTTSSLTLMVTLSGLKADGSMFTFALVAIDGDCPNSTSKPTPRALKQQAIINAFVLIMSKRLRQDSVLQVLFIRLSFPARILDAPQV